MEIKFLISPLIPLPIILNPCLLIFDPSAKENGFLPVTLSRPLIILCTSIRSLETYTIPLPSQMFLHPLSSHSQFIFAPGSCMCSFMCLNPIHFRSFCSQENRLSLFFFNSFSNPAHIPTNLHFTFKSAIRSFLEYRTQNVALNCYH